MSSRKVFKVQAARRSEVPRNLQEALELAEKTGVLQVPAEAMQLTVDSGVAVEVENGRK
jgi:hypothetical protein